MAAIVVIPTYNERSNLADIVAKIRHYAGGLDILIVDDNSPDGTGALAEELSRARDHAGKLFVLHRQEKRGLGRAYVAGFSEALKRGYEIIAQMDADLSHNPRYLPRLLEELDQCDLVVGSRYLNGISVVNWDLKRLILSKMATIYVRVMTRMPFTDLTSGFKCWRRSALESLDIEKSFANGYLFQIETTYEAFRRGFRVTEIPIIFVERNLGRSKMSWQIILEAFVGVVVLKLKAWRQGSVDRPNMDRH